MSIFCQNVSSKCQYYTSFVWDNPVLHEDSLVEMVSATKDTRDALDEDTVMLTDSGILDEESRRGESRSKSSDSREQEKHV